MGQNVGQPKPAKARLEVKGDGLMLRRRGSTGTWILRVQTHGVRRDITIGTDSAFSLREARDAVARIRKAIEKGDDPRSALNKPTSARTLGEAVESYIEAARPKWRSPLEEKHTRSQLTRVFAGLLDRPVSTIRKGDLLPPMRKVAEKPTVYAKLLYRTRGVFTRELALGHIAAQPVEWSGIAYLVTPARHEVQHHPAPPWKDAPFFWDCVKARFTPAAVCLKMLILTAVRSREAREARWSEIDLKAGIWTIPAARTKTKTQALEVPLSKQAIELLKVMPRTNGDLLFPGQRDSEKAISDMGLLKEQRLMPGEYTVHGWRSAFRDWGGETGQDIILLELALGHAVGSRVERAYARSTLRERRRPVMQAWADFVTAQK